MTELVVTFDVGWASLIVKLIPAPGGGPVSVVGGVGRHLGVREVEGRLELRAEAGVADLVDTFGYR